MLDGYEQWQLLGRGGMGEVYRAYDTRLRRLVAIKRLRGALPTADQSERFRREAEALAQLQHSNIVQVHAWEVEDKQTR